MIMVFIFIGSFVFLHLKVIDIGGWILEWW